MLVKDVRSPKARPVCSHLQKGPPGDKCLPSDHPTIRNPPHPLPQPGQQRRHLYPALPTVCMAISRGRCKILPDAIQYLTLALLLIPRPPRPPPETHRPLVTLPLNLWPPRLPLQTPRPWIATPSIPRPRVVVMVVEEDLVAPLVVDRVNAGAFSVLIAAPTATASMT